MQFFTASILALATLSQSQVVIRRPSSCHQPLNKNLLGNGGFEKSPVSILPWHLEKSVLFYGKSGILRPGSNSPQAYGVNTQNYTFGVIEQNFDACQPWYTLSWDQKLSISAGGGESGAFVGSNYTALSFPADNTATNGTFTHKAENIYSSLDGGTVYYSWATRQGYGGEIAFDNIKLLPLGTISTDPNAPNRIRNGGFENGQFAPWQTADKHRCTVSAPGRHSSKALHCNFTANKSRFDILRFSQAITTTSQTQYIFSYDFKNVQTTASGHNEGCTLVTSLGPVVFQAQGLSLPNPNNTWTQIAIPFIAQGSDTLVKMEVDAFSHCNITFDNFSMREAS